MVSSDIKAEFGWDLMLHFRSKYLMHSMPVQLEDTLVPQLLITESRICSFWPSMKADILSMVQKCNICQQAKPDRAQYRGLLQPLPVPASSWDVISMDFIEGLPKAGNANAILVVIDEFTKFGHLIPLHHPFTTSTVAKAFMDHVYKLHGMPSAIISDRDRIFTSNFWQCLFKMVGPELKMSTAVCPL